MTPNPKDSLILQAAIEFGPEYTYTIKKSTLGPALYVHAPDRQSAAAIRKTVPLYWNSLYTLVLYSGSTDLFEDPFPLYDPNLK